MDNRMNLYQWIVTVLVRASESNPLPAHHYNLDGNGDGAEMEYTTGLSDFINDAATEYARLMLSPGDKEKTFSRPVFYRNMEYFAEALYRLLTECTPVASDLTIRFWGDHHPWDSLSIDATHWELNGPFPWNEGYQCIPYGIEFSSWDRWLGMGISPRFFTLPAAHVLAHVIWEMTFSGMGYIHGDEENEDE